MTQISPLQSVELRSSGIFFSLSSFDTLIYWLTFSKAQSLFRPWLNEKKRKERAATTRNWSIWNLSFITSFLIYVVFLFFLFKLFQLLMKEAVWYFANIPERRKKKDFKHTLCHFYTSVFQDFYDLMVFHIFFTYFSLFSFLLWVFLYSSFYGTVEPSLSFRLSLTPPAPSQAHFKCRRNILSSSKWQNTCSEQSTFLIFLINFLLKL